MAKWTAFAQRGLVYGFLEEFEQPRTALSQCEKGFMVRAIIGLVCEACWNQFNISCTPAAYGTPSGG